MASGAISGIGAIFQRWSGSSWVAFAEVNSITPPNPTRETIDVTSLDSSDGYKEFIASIRDGGTVSLSMNFLVAGYTIIKDDFESDDLQNYEIVLPDTANTSLEFEGLITEMPIESVVVDDKISNTVTIKISGSVTLNSGGSDSPA